MTALADFAGHEFRLCDRGQDGVSLRETLEVIARRTGVMPDEGINPCELPPICAHVWSWFLQLNQERPVSDMGGPQPLSSAHLLAWMQLEQLRLEAWEVLALRRLDKVAMNHLAEASKKAAASKRASK